MKKMRSVVMGIVLFMSIITPHFVWADWYDRYRPGGYYGGYYQGYYYPKYYHRGYYRGYAEPRYFCRYCHRYHPVGWHHYY